MRSDMEQASAEFVAILNCGYTEGDRPYEGAKNRLTLAIWDVIEPKIREGIAKDILDQETWLRGCVDFTANERQVGMINGYRLAARIAKGDNR